MRSAIASTFTAAYVRQDELLSDRDSPIHTFTHQARGRFSENEVEGLLRSVSAIAHPHGRAADAAGKATFEEAGNNHGWRSYRAVGVAPTDGDVALAILWRFTVPYRDCVVSEIEGMWPHTVGDPLTAPEPRQESEPIVVGDTALHVGPDMSTIWMRDGVFDSAVVEDILKPRVYTEGGVDLLSAGEIDLLKRVVRALVDRDRTVLAEIGPFDGGSDPYLWTRDYGRFGDVHFVMPPGELANWRVDVMQVDDAPGVSFLVVGMWTREEGASDLSLELNLTTDPEDGSIRGEFVDLHVM